MESNDTITLTLGDLLNLISCKGAKLGLVTIYINSKAYMESIDAIKFDFSDLYKGICEAPSEFESLYLFLSRGVTPYVTNKH